MEYKSLSEKPLPVTPRIIIHGGAGNITRDNLPPKSYSAYRESLLSILSRAEDKLRVPGAAALDVATFAVSLLEENPLFNAGRGAVYTTNGTHELEASVMVSKGYIKRGCGVMKVTKAKSPIKLAREMLVRGELQNGGGAQGHCQLEGETCDRLNAEWGLEMARPSYFWTRRRWDEHRRGLGLSHDDATYDKHKREADQGCADALVDDGYDGLQDPHWDGKEYLPQGTVGAVVLDSSGTVCAATSTGGLTNKLPGRIGDTPTLGAGYWAEEWSQSERMSVEPSLNMARYWMSDCLPFLPDPIAPRATEPWRQYGIPRAVGMSGTGNGDSFLKINAVRTAAAISRYSGGDVSLQTAVSAVAGPYGQLQQSAGDRWGKTGEGEGGIIGVECRRGKGYVVFDHNCGGMFRAWVDERGEKRFAVFQDELRY